MEIRRSQPALFAQEKNPAALAASICPQPGHSVWSVGPACICFASLGTALSLTPLSPQMTQCTLTLKQCVVAVVRTRASRETFPVRDLFPISLSASVRNLLGHLVANKKEIPYFNHMPGWWICACLFCHSCSHIAKCLSERRQRLAFVQLRRWNQKRQIAQNCPGESAEK